MSRARFVAAATTGAVGPAVEYEGAGGGVEVAGRVAALMDPFTLIAATLFNSPFTVPRLALIHVSPVTRGTLTLSHLLSGVRPATANVCPRTPVLTAAYVVPGPLRRIARCTVTVNLTAPTAVAGCAWKSSRQINRKANRSFIARLHLDLP